MSVEYNSPLIASDDQCDEKGDAPKFGCSRNFSKEREGAPAGKEINIETTNLYRANFPNIIPASTITRTVIILSLCLLCSPQLTSAENPSTTTTSSNSKSGGESFLVVTSPLVGQVNHGSGAVSVDCRIRSTDHNAAYVSNAKQICWKVVPDLDCLGPLLSTDGNDDDITKEHIRHMNDEEKQAARRHLKTFAMKMPHQRCSRFGVEDKVKGTLVLNSACWVFQFDLLHISEYNTKAVVDTEYRSVDIVTVDQHVAALYPNVKNIPGGTVQMFKHAIRSRFFDNTNDMRWGGGLTLEFGLGETTEIMSRLLLLSQTEKRTKNILHDDEMESFTLHSFDSLRGLPEKWRDGYDIGKFSLGGVVPDYIGKTSNVIVHKGLVQDTLQPFLDQHPMTPLGVLVLDLSIESASAFVLNQLICRFAKGTIVVFGSYFNYPDWTEIQGERSAWLSAVERWDIEFEPIGFHSTFYAVRIAKTPRTCTALALAKLDDDVNREEHDDWVIDPTIEGWAQERLAHANGLIGKDKDALVSVLEEIIAVDHNNEVALGMLAFAVEDVHRTVDRFEYARRALLLQHAIPPLGTDVVTLLTTLHKHPSFENPFRRKVRKHRLVHDYQQLRYLRDRDLLPRDLATRAIDAYNETLSELTDVAGQDMVLLSWLQWSRIGLYFNRVLHLPVVSRIGTGALNPSIDFEEVHTSYTRHDPHIVVVDDFFSTGALNALERYYREATVFYDYNHPSYLGSYITDGLGNPVLAQVIEEVSDKLRPILCDRPLVQAWTYKYDPTLERGINIHADKAAVNLNIWLTENESLGDDDGHGGGLIIYTKKPPEDWTFDMFNVEPTPPAVLDMLRESGYQNITVPYKQNRMVMFDSMLYHVSDVGKWKRGYKSRRINLTLLFGRMGSVCENSSKADG